MLPFSPGSSQYMLCHARSTSGICGVPEAQFCPVLRETVRFSYVICIRHLYPFDILGILYFLALRAHVPLQEAHLLSTKGMRSRTPKPL